MAWIYYKETTPDGNWNLFREADGKQDQAYNLKRGWINSPALWERMIKGDVDSQDIVDEAEAERLIQSLGGLRAS